MVEIDLFFELESPILLIMRVSDDRGTCASSAHLLFFFCVKIVSFWIVSTLKIYAQVQIINCIFNVWIFFESLKLCIKILNILAIIQNFTWLTSYMSTYVENDIWIRCRKMCLLRLKPHLIQFKCRIVCSIFHISREFSSYGGESFLNQSSSIIFEEI